MNIKEYKDRKDKLRSDIELLVREFNRETETVISSMDVDISLSYEFGSKKPFMAVFNCSITTEIDK